MLIVVLMMLVLVMALALVMLVLVLILALVRPQVLMLSDGHHCSTIADNIFILHPTHQVLALVLNLAACFIQGLSCPGSAMNA